MLLLCLITQYLIKNKKPSDIKLCWIRWKVSERNLWTNGKESIVDLEMKPRALIGNNQLEISKTSIVFLILPIVNYLSKKTPKSF